MVGTHRLFRYCAINCDGKFIFKVNMLSRLLKFGELSNEWVLINLNYQEPVFYAKLFDDSEEGPSGVPTGCTHVGIIRN